MPYKAHKREAAFLHSLFLCAKTYGKSKAFSKAAGEKERRIRVKGEWEKQFCEVSTAARTRNHRTRSTKRALEKRQKKGRF